MLTASDLRFVVAQMKKAGCTPDQIGAVTAAIADPPKSGAAIRKARSRAAQSVTVTRDSHVDSHVEPDRSLARGRARASESVTKNLKDSKNREHKCSLQEKISPRAVLETVLSSEHAAAVVAHRARLKRPLTAHAAKLLAKEFAKLAKPDDGADMMIARGWQGFDATWFNKPAESHRNGHARPRTQAERNAEFVRKTLRPDDDEIQGIDDRPGAIIELFPEEFSRQPCDASKRH